MKITKITPRGFCKGVVDAWMLTKKARQDFPTARIIMIGQLVHNQEMIENVKKENIEIIDDTNTSRLEIVKNLEPDNNTVLIFSAHGTDEQAITLANKKGFKIIDATCIYVSKTRNIIKEKIVQGFEIIFIGKQNHPETLAILSINNNIIFLENKNDINHYSFDKNKNYFLTNQTTISIYDFYEIIKELKKLIPHLVCENEICTATQERQEAIINMDKSIDLLIVVGDKKSNNSTKLAELGLKQNVESYLISNKDDIKPYWFNNKKHIGITSGASTPTWVTNDVIKYVELNWGNHE